jgi:hypothetical protein
MSDSKPIMWSDLTPDQQEVLKLLPVSVINGERELYDKHKETVHELVEMKLARPTLTMYKRIEAGEYVLAQADSAKPEGGAEVSDAVALARAQIARLRSALETIRDYPAVEADMELGHQVAGMAMQAEVALEEFPSESGLLTILANKLTTAQADLATAREQVARLQAALEDATRAISTSLELVKRVDNQLDTITFNMKQVVRVEPEGVTRAVDNIRRDSKNAVTRLGIGQQEAAAVLAGEGGA